MTRILSPDDACHGVDVPFGRKRRYNGQVFEVSDPGHVRALREAGFSVADVSGVPSKSAGFECSECSFQSFFRLCSRCGATCERPDLVA